MEPIARLGAEENVLGAMLCSDHAVDRAVGQLKPEHFYRESHGFLFGLIAQMHEAGVPVDITSVLAYGEEHGGLEKLGGGSRIQELATIVPATANILHHSALVKDAFTKRRILNSCLDIQSRIEGMTAEEALEAFEGAALDVAAETQQRHKTIIDLKTAISEFEEKMKHPLEEEDGIPVPFRFLDKLVGGRLYILGGYQADGKTAAMLQFVTAAAASGRKVAVASLEMSYHDLFDRYLATQTGIKYRALRTGNLQGWEIDTAKLALQEMSGWNVKVIDDETLRPSSLRKYQKLGNYEVLFIDHLHRMEWKDRQAIESGVKAITNIAREFDIPVVLLAQLTRAGDWKNPFPVPTQKSLRESGMIEAEAAHIWFVYRDRDETTHQRLDTGKFIVAKNRYGSEWIEPMAWDWHRQVWEPTRDAEALTVAPTAAEGHVDDTLDV